MPDTDENSWIQQLSTEDVAFLKRFVLASGSLKDLATSYGISYPTIRLRLDRLIDKIKLLDSRAPGSEFERLLGVQLVEGKIDAATFKELLSAYRKETESNKNSKMGGVL
jgi:hypothetical protein